MTDGRGRTIQPGMASVPDRDLSFNVEEQRVRIAKMLTEIEKAGIEQQKVLADRLRVEQETRFAPFTLLATGAGAAAGEVAGFRLLRRVRAAAPPNTTTSPSTAMAAATGPVGQWPVRASSAGTRAVSGLASTSAQPV